jgi:hypothetical protein
MTAPFPVTDYYSALAYADWLEDHGLPAGAARERCRPPTNDWSRSGSRSGSGSGSGSRSWSWSGN